MKNTQKRIFLASLAVMLCTLTASAQRTLSGNVMTEDRKSLAGVIINVYDHEKCVAFGSSKSDGSYRLTIPETYAKRLLTVSFSKLNYKKQTHDLPVGKTSLSTIMIAGDATLREVIVKAPPVIQKGDTLRFSMGQFKTGTDLNLEDGLKRIPGITVSDDGAISYMGRDISQFYIEGLDLLGGRYNLATRNIPVDKVTGVEVLRHHQHNKVFKDELTNDVALNIRLADKAKIKPFGTYEARAGIEEKHPLYGISGTAMLFRKKFQLLTTLKLSNEGRLGVDESITHFGTNRTSRSRLVYEWQSPLSFWFLNTSVSYTRNFSNIMHGQDMNGNNLSLTEQQVENTDDNIYIDAKVSKYLLTAKTNIVIGGHYTWSNAQMLSSGKQTTVYGSGYGGYVEVRSNPIMQLEAFYRAEGTFTQQELPEQRSNYTNYNQRFKLTYSPIEILNFHAGGEWRYTTLADGNHKTAMLLDARAEYKLRRKIRLRLEMNNLLNKKNYCYTVYSGLNSYNYDYLLRGREFLISFICMP